MLINDPPSNSAFHHMDIPQSNTDDCLLNLTNSSDDLSTPPKPPYPLHFTKNGVSQHQQHYQHQRQHPLRKQSQQHSGDPQTSSSLQSLQPHPPIKDFTNCNSQSLGWQKTPAASRRPSGISFIGYKYSRAVVQDPTTGCCLRTFCRGWIGILQLLIALRAILARFVFLALTMTLVVTVVSAKGQNIYWLLCFLMLPLLVDLCYSIGLVVAPSRAQDRTEKW